jgi:hypothetical protein
VIPSWKAFFERRRARNERLKARETPKNRQSRESREKNPPVKHTKVFLWTQTENGEYRRESFYQAENGMHLDAYGKNQKVYDVKRVGLLLRQLSQDDVDDADIDDDFSMPSTPADQALGPDRDTPVPDPLVLAASQPAPAVDRSFSIARPAEIPFDWHDFGTPPTPVQILWFRWSSSSSHPVIFRWRSPERETSSRGDSRRNGLWWLAKGNLIM